MLLHLLDHPLLDACPHGHRLAAFSSASRLGLPQDHAALEGDQLIGDRIATALAAEHMAGLACPCAAEGIGDVQLGILKDQHRLTRALFKLS